jgi:putative MFS transporter
MASAVRRGWLMSSSVQPTSVPFQAAQLNIPGRLERLPMTSYQKRLFAIVATAWLADQIDVALLVFLIGDLKNYFALTPVQVGYLASMTFLGQLVGNILIGSLSDLYGRRLAFQSTMIIWGVASFLAATAWDVTSLMVFRFLIGVGVGGEAPVAQAVLSEIIPANVRAKYIAFMEGFWAVGFILSGAISYLVLPIAGWRWVFVVVGLLSAVVFWVRQSLLESPRWLADHGRLEEAETVMSRMEAGVAAALGKPLPEPKPFLAETTLETRNPLAVLFSRFYLRANVMAFTVWFFALLGYYGLTSWLAVILGEHGFSVVKSVGFITLITFGGIPGFYTAALLLERIGRKPTTAVFLFMSATMAYVYGHSHTTTALFISGFVMQFFMFGMWSVSTPIRRSSIPPVPVLLGLEWPRHAAASAPSPDRSSSAISSGPLAIREFLRSAPRVSPWPHWRCSLWEWRHADARSKKSAAGRRPLRRR